MSVVWSLMAALFTVLITYYYDSKKKNDVPIKKNFRTGLFIGLLVFSHWWLDLIGWPMTVMDLTATGVPLLFDMTQTIGLGVYTTWIGALTMEFAAFIGGFVLYLYYRKKQKKQFNKN